MKWFKHHSDAHNNLKFQRLFNDFGSEGYGLFWICVELVAREGTNYRISAKKDWISYLQKFSGIEKERVKKILVLFGELNLVDKKALNKGDLYLPKLRERVDEYTEKVGRKSRQGRDNVPLEQNRTDKNKTEESNVGKKPFFNGLPLYKIWGKWKVRKGQNDFSEFSNDPADWKKVVYK